MNHTLKLALSAFVSTLAGSSLVQGIVAGGHLNVGRDAIVSVLVGAAVAAVHVLIPENKE